jgi:hypothetical protein
MGISTGNPAYYNPYSMTQRIHAKTIDSRGYFLLEKYLKMWFFAPFSKNYQANIIELPWTLFYESYNS